MTGLEQHHLLQELGPLRRDLLSPGYRDAMGRITERFPDVVISEFPSGATHWGWPVPNEWRFLSGRLESMGGETILDLSDHPLRVGSYSVPVDAILAREDLLAHLRTHPHLPDALPFSFHYYRPEWTIGVTQQEREALKDARYRVVLETESRPGALQVGEWLLRGEEDREFVLAAHLCHPAQVSDGLSGVVTGLAVMRHLACWPSRRFSYRLLIGPETIGSVAWLSTRQEHLSRILGGLFLEMTGLDEPGALQHAFDAASWLDSALTTGFFECEPDGWDAPHRAIVGNDERQFNGVGVRIPMLSFSRAVPRTRPEAPFAAYHSSGDTADLVSPDRLEQTVGTVLGMLRVLEQDYLPVGNFRGEPFLSGAGIPPDDPAFRLPHRTRLMVLDYLDGSTPLSAIARKLQVPFAEVRLFVDRLAKAGLVTPEPIPADFRHSPG